MELSIKGKKFWRKQFSDMSDKELEKKCSEYVEKILDAHKRHEILTYELGKSREELERQTSIMVICFGISNERNKIPKP